MQKLITEIPLANANVQILRTVYLKGNKDINQYYWWKFGEPFNEDAVLLIAGKGYGIYVHYNLKVLLNSMIGKILKPAIYLQI